MTEKKHTIHRMRFAAFRTRNLRTDFLLLITVSATAAIILFCFLLSNIGTVWKQMQNLPPFSFDLDTFLEMLQEKALSCEVPEYDDGKNFASEMGDFFTGYDDYYTGVYVYGKKDGLYRASTYAKVMDSPIFSTFLEWGTSRINASTSINIYDAHDMTFSNGVYSVYVHSYRSTIFILPYMSFSLCLSITVFLIPLLKFISRHIRDIMYLKQEILQMASGDLSHPIAQRGAHEIGTLCTELDHLRIALHDQIEKEEESRSANQDLITAMSHDLRTPLTILRGYLEVLQLKQEDASFQEDYLARCIQKTDDIKTMTDRMFEYALVFGEEETIREKSVPVSFLSQCIRENMDFLSIAGFQSADITLPEQGTLSGDENMLKRIFHNLFSNILKYGDKSVPVGISFLTGDGTIELSICNAVKKDCGTPASNGIGLKSVEKMMRLHRGILHHTEEHGNYVTVLSFPVHDTH